jgi:hypothetical protein
MLTREEEQFYNFWQNNREDFSKFSSKLLRGLPTAALFGLPIILLIAIIYFFVPDWYIKISKTSAESYIVVFIAIVIFISFFAYFKMHFKWEMNEQYYLELKNKKDKQAAF